MRVPLTPLRFKQRALALYGKKLGVVCGNFRFSYREFFERCDRLSRALESLGVRRGDRVAFLAYNCHRLLEAYYGVIQAGAILIPLNIRLTGPDFSAILRDAEARVLFFESDLREIVGGIRREIPCEHLIPIDIPTSVKWDSTRSYDDLLVEAGPEPYQAVEPDEEDVAEIFYTSGTTGTPKGVMLTHRNLYTHALSSIIGLGISDREVQLHTIPLFHVNGWGAPQSVTAVGGTHVMLPRFDPGEALRLMETECVTSLSLVPTMAVALLNHPDRSRRRHPNLRMINLGGAAASAPLVRNLEEAFGCTCFSGYGLTETSPILTLSSIRSPLQGLPPEESVRRKAMTGFPLIGVELRIVDDDGKDVRPDGTQTGEIIVRGDGVMKGYWRKPEETAQAIRDGWFYTGDMATIDEEGYVLIVDRKKDIIISGGENISSLEIEKCIFGHPDVLECAVLAVPDEKWGEVPKAVVVRREGSQLTENDLLEYCRQHLAAFKCPRSVDFAESLPKGGTGKILKRTLREKYWTGESKRIRG
jgi:fatty-acyl-CoA synthase